MYLENHSDTPQSFAKEVKRSHTTTAQIGVDSKFHDFFQLKTNLSYAKTYEEVVKFNVTVPGKKKAQLLTWNNTDVYQFSIDGKNKFNVYRPTESEGSGIYFWNL